MSKSNPETQVTNHHASSGDATPLEAMDHGIMAWHMRSGQQGPCWSILT